MNIQWVKCIKTMKGKDYLEASMGLIQSFQRLNKFDLMFLASIYVALTFNIIVLAILASFSSTPL